MPKDCLKHTFLLIPGYGAQGGTGRDLMPFFKNGVCGVVNASRSLLTAHKGKTEAEDFDIYIRKAVEIMHKDIVQWL